MKELDSNEIILFWQNTITQKHVYSKNKINIHIYMKQVLLFHIENDDE